MTIALGQWTFVGPHLNTDYLRAQSGVYAILGQRASSPSWEVVDIGESGEVRQRVTTHDRRPCWERQGYARLSVAAFYCDERTRIAIESSLRAQYKPPCGDR